MQGKIENLEEKARQNNFFRQVLETGEHTQIVVMSVKDEIGEEIHPDNDQVLYLVEGEGEVILNDISSSFKRGDAILVRAGTKHNFVNKDITDMKIITTYSPPHHPAGTIHETREEAMSAGY